MALGFVPDSPLEFMKTRPITSQDTAPVADLVQLVRERPNDLVDPFPPATEIEILADMGARGRGPGRPRVALERGEVVGWGAVDFSPAMKRAALVGPVVHPAHRTKGHGRNLIQALVQNARDAHQKHVRVCLGAHNGAGQALLRAEAHHKGMVEDFLREVLRLFPEGGTRVFGPMPAIMERMDGRSRMYLVLLSENRSDLHGQIDRWLPLIRQTRLARKIRWSVDIDPQEL